MKLFFYFWTRLTWVKVFNDLEVRWNKDCSPKKISEVCDHLLVNPDLVLPLKPKFYCLFIDDTYRRRKKNKPEELFSKVNSYHPNMNLTIEINPSKFLDTKIPANKNEIKCFSHHKDNKLPFHWKFAMPGNYKKYVVVETLIVLIKLVST